LEILPVPLGDSAVRIMNRQSFPFEAAHYPLFCQARLGEVVKSTV